MGERGISLDFLEMWRLSVRDVGLLGTVNTNLAGVPGDRALGPILLAWFITAAEDYFMETKRRESIAEKLMKIYEMDSVTAAAASPKGGCNTVQLLWIQQSVNAV